MSTEGGTRANDWREDRKATNLYKTRFGWRIHFSVFDPRTKKWKRRSKRYLHSMSRQTVERRLATYERRAARAHLKRAREAQARAAARIRKNPFLTTRWEWVATGIWTSSYGWRIRWRATHPLTGKRFTDQKLFGPEVSQEDVERARQNRVRDDALARAAIRKRKERERKKRAGGLSPHPWVAGPWTRVGPGTWKSEHGWRIRYQATHPETGKRVTRTKSFEPQTSRKDVERSRAALQTPAPGRAPTVRRRVKLDALRRECGWTVQRLADQMMMRKATVQDHLTRNTDPHPGTLRAYAAVFSTVLGRAVTVSDLED